MSPCLFNCFPLATDEKEKESDLGREVEVLAGYP